MAGILKRVLGPVQTTTTASATRFTVGDGLAAGGSGKNAYTKVRIINISVVNTHTSAVALNASIGADGAATRLYDAFSIASKGILDRNCNLILKTGEFIEFKEDVGSKLTLIVTAEILDVEVLT